MNRDIDNLLNEVRLIYNRFVQVGEKLHEDEPVTLGMRAVLEFLLKNGPTTVPDIARSRSVTRQHIQVLVNDLLDEELAALEDNPLHKRSLLVTLTRKGKQVIRSMQKREDQFFQATKFGVKRDELKEAARILQRVREALRLVGDRP